MAGCSSNNGRQPTHDLWGRTKWGYVNFSKRGNCAILTAIVTPDLSGLAASDTVTLEASLLAGLWVLGIGIGPVVGLGDCFIIAMQFWPFHSSLGIAF